MTRHVDLPDTIPVFPLPGALLLPRARLPLHIFEPRYLTMLEDVLKTPARLIGMVQPCMVPGNGGNRLQQIGCAGRVTQFSETEDGRYMITLTGISRFRVRNEIEGFSPYRRCDVSWAGFEKDQGAEEHDPGLNRDGFMDLLSRFFQLRGLNADWGNLSDADDELMINSLSMMLDFAPEDKQALLEAPCLSTRRETLVTLIEYALRGGEHEETVQ
ncbi:LON peptidase substrate-binding domain-containing protein [Thalassovita sp.]|uniref:LON peptidase substrate-binding domain-containing protein n=1 Tax=Thalassovita sp. TaxID=1979401 RepID=UPI002B274322|nr:LON peptidase substrate-binding domain-containing protein [Thalassovita sp.]